MMEQKENKNGVNIKCPICNHEWTYRGNLRRATCSSCGKKVNVEKNIIFREFEDL